MTTRSVGKGETIPIRLIGREAWQRLVRVLGREINNSLAPIKSIAASLTGLLARDPRPADLDEDLTRGLDVIAARADALSRFMTAYARLARLPPPRPVPLSIDSLIRRVASLETRMTVEVVGGPDLTVHTDADQLEQLLINLQFSAKPLCEIWYLVERQSETIDDAQPQRQRVIVVGFKPGRPASVICMTQSERPRSKRKKSAAQRSLRDTGPKVSSSEN